MTKNFNIDSAKITGIQFMFCIACFIQASSLLTSFLDSISVQDSWIVVLMGFIICLPLVWLYRTLMVIFPGQNLIQMLISVYGTVAGKILGIVYLWFFLTLTSLNATDLGDLARQTIMRNTPNIVLVFLCVAVSALAVRYGIKVVARYGALFTTIAWIITISTVIFLINEVKLEHFLPFFNMEPIKYVQGTHLISTIPFGEVIVFLMLAPNITLSKRDTGKYLFRGFILGAASVFVVVARDIAVLGNTIQMFTIPSLVTLHLVNVGTTLSRMEILFSIVLIMLLFFKISLLYYITVITISQIMNIKAYKHIVLAAGVLIIYYGFTLYPNPMDHLDSAHQIVPALWTLFEFIIPVITLIAAKLRGFPKAAEA